MPSNAGDAAVEKFIAEFLTTGQAARFLECGEALVRQLADEGRIRVARTPSGWRLFPRAELERFRQERGR
jgi:excisionase family DNA binding protein